MRVCDKCRTNIVTTIWQNKKDGTEYDFCAPCFAILQDWMTNQDRKQMNDPVEQRRPGRPKKEA
jgi:ribosomal protein L34E